MSTVQEISQAIEHLNVHDQMRLLHDLPAHLKIQPDDVAWLKAAEPALSSGTTPRMPSTTSFSQGDVVLVPFPFTDLSAIKQRPALVLSPDRSNKVRPDLVVAAITSQIPPTLGDDEMLLSGNELKESGLPKPSIIKLSKIFTIHQGLIRKKIGYVSDSTRGEILEKLMQSMR